MVKNANACNFPPQCQYHQNIMSQHAALQHEKSIQNLVTQRSTTAMLFQQHKTPKAVVLACCKGNSEARQGNNLKNAWHCNVFFLLFQNAQQTFHFPVAQRHALHFFGETCEDNTFQTKPEATNWIAQYTPYSYLVRKAGFSWKNVYEKTVMKTYHLFCLLSKIGNSSAGHHHDLSLVWGYLRG